LANLLLSRRSMTERGLVRALLALYVISGAVAISLAVV